MTIRRRDLLATGAATLAFGGLPDMSGPYRDVTGPGSTVCTQQIEVLQADHQNRPCSA